VPERETRLVVIVPRAAGLGSDAVRYDKTATQQSDVSRDLQRTLLLCCSVDIEQVTGPHESPEYIG
jgi:hypothetical protein